MKCRLLRHNSLGEGAHSFPRGTHPLPLLLLTVRLRDNTEPAAHARVVFSSETVVRESIAICYVSARALNRGAFADFHPRDDDSTRRRGGPFEVVLLPGDVEHSMRRAPQKWKVNSSCPVLSRRHGPKVCPEAD